MKTAPLLPLQQHPSFGAALALLGTRTGIETLAGAAPLQTIHRFGVKFVPRGPVWEPGTHESAMAEELRRARPSVINSDAPSASLKAAGYRQVMTTAYVAELPLSGTSDERMRRAHGKWRNSWRKAQRSKLKFKRERFDHVLHQWLLSADTAQRCAKHYRDLPHDITRAFAAVNPSDTLLFTARIKRDPVAAMLFLRHGAVATYHLGWSSHTGRSLNTHHALLMHAADHFATEGVQRLDLGTVDTESAPGLARFKIRSGAHIRPLGGTWLRIPGL